MLRINLLLDSGGSGGSTQGSGYSLPTFSGDDPFDLVIKISLAILPVVLIYAYNFYNTVQKKDEVSRLQMEVTVAKEKLKSLDPDVKEIEKFQEEKRKLDSQLDVIKKLSKERLKNVKSLDALQDIIPQKAWISDLKFNENKVELTGYATDDIVISEFMHALGSSIYFANVNLTASTEEKRSEGVVKKFMIKCNLENL